LIEQLSNPFFELKLQILSHHFRDVTLQLLYAVFVYYVEIELIDGETKIYKGDVTVILEFQEGLIKYL
jgi:hypothetical protein